MTFFRSSGEPEKGFHFRVKGVAILDVTGAIVVARYASKYTPQPFIISSLVFLVVVGELLHWVFGVETAVLRYTGLVRSQANSGHTSFHGT